MSDPIQLISALVIAGFAGLIVVGVFARFPEIAILAILISFFVGAILGNNIPIASYGSTSFYLLDILTGALLIAAGARLLYARQWPRWISVPTVALIGLLAVSLLRGVLSFGIERSVNLARLYLYFVSTLLFGASLRFTRQLVRRLLYWWGIVAWLLVGLLVVRLALVSIGAFSSPDWTAPSGAPVRVLNAAQAFVLLQTLLFAWYSSSERLHLPLGRILPYVLVPAIVVLQHRTVWVVLIGILLLVIVRDRRMRRRWSAGLIAITILAIFGGIGFVGTSAVNSLMRSAQDLRTFDWRLASWSAAMSPDRFQSPWDYLVGQPFGTGYERYLAGRDSPTSVSPHDFYVQTFLNLGIAGLAGLFVLYAGLLGLLGTGRGDGVATTLSLLLTSQLIFSITYALSYEQGLLLGLAIAFCRSAVPICNPALHLRLATPRSPSVSA